MKLELERRQEVFVLRLDAGENRFSPALLDAFEARLAEVEKADGPRALVTVGTGKFFSNGLDLDYMTGPGRADAGGYLARVLRLLGRVLTLPCPSVAAVNGHAFGAGAQLALVHDRQVMRADRGYFCMPEIDMGVPLHPGMVAILKARLPARSAHECVVTGRRYGGAEALAAGIVDETAPEERVLALAVERAAALASKAHPAMASLKRGLYQPVLDAIEIPLDAAMRAAAGG
jgi:enoyl-CoA hydratase/carnithine racemase